MLYNHHNARKAAHEQGTVIAVEGYVDVIAMTRGGLSACRRAARHGADRRPVRTALEDGGGADPLLRRRQGRPQGRLSRGRHGSAADRAGPHRCASRFCRKGRTLTISPAPAARRRSKQVLATALPLVDLSGCAKPRRHRSTRPSAAPRSERRLRRNRRPDQRRDAAPLLCAQELQSGSPALVRPGVARPARGRRGASRAGPFGRGGRADFRRCRPEARQADRRAAVRSAPASPIRRCSRENPPACRRAKR